MIRNEIEAILFKKHEIPKSRIEKRLNQHQQWQKIKLPGLIDESILCQVIDQFASQKLTGIGVSPGIITGKARVLTNLQELSQIQQGEILVVPTTDPGWTPLFSIIAGLVMEVGGVLSHGSIVAREFGIPAVTSVQQATSLITTGISIIVNGNDGTVWIAENESKRPTLQAVKVIKL